MSEQDEQFDASSLLDQGGEDQDASNESSTGGEERGEQTPEEAPPGMEIGDINEASEGGGPDELPEEDQPPSSHTIENHLGEEIVISAEALDYINHLQNQLEAEQEEVERLNTQVQRLNRSTSIGRR